MFRTELNPKNSELKISHSTPIITVGSCFSDQIGSFFIKNKFDIISNPFGTVYNPDSIHKLLYASGNNVAPNDDSIIVHQGLFSHYDFHSSFSTTSKSELKNSVVATVKETNQCLHKSKFLIITYGTAFVYVRNDNNEIVANCHKAPAKQFTKRLLTEAEIVASFRRMYDALSKLNNNLQIILTVSPVRHLKDTIELNSVSKSVLRLACHKLTSDFKGVSYFPSYELVLDDLRDYRFYKADMIHPTEVAEEYIWQKFQQVYFNENTVVLLAEWKKLSAAIAHRPFNPESNAHQNFLISTLEKLKKIKHRLNVSQEIEDVEKQLISGD